MKTTAVLTVLLSSAVAAFAAVPPEQIEDRLSEANSLRTRRQFDAAERLYKDVLESANDSQRAKTLNNLGALSFDRGRYDEALKWYAEAISVWEAMPRPECAARRIPTAAGSESSGPGSGRPIGRPRRGWQTSSSAPAEPASARAHSACS